MKSFNNLKSELQAVITLDELEAGADLFDYGLSNNSYSYSQVKQFNEIYWNMKNKIITKSISNQFYKVDYTQLKSIVTGASTAIKENNVQLSQYINERLRALKSKFVA